MNNRTKARCAFNATKLKHVEETNVVVKRFLARKTALRLIQETEPRNVAKYGWLRNHCNNILAAVIFLQRACPYRRTVVVNIRQQGFLRIDLEIISGFASFASSLPVYIPISGCPFVTSPTREHITYWLCEYLPWRGTFIIVIPIIQSNFPLTPQYIRSIGTRRCTQLKHR